MKRLWFWDWLKVGGEGDDRVWDGWMASMSQWTWVRVNSGSWWWTARPVVLQSMGSQRVGHDWVTELNWIVSQTPEFCLLPQCLTEFWMKQALEVHHQASLHSSSKYHLAVSYASFTLLNLYSRFQNLIICCCSL